MQAEPRRRPLLEDLQPHDTVSGFDAPPLVVLVAVVVMIVLVAVRVVMSMPVVVVMVMARVL